MTKRRDLVIVGRGAVGLGAAWAAADQGLSVIVVGERASSDGQATGAAGAMLGVFGEVTAGGGEAADEELVARLAARELHHRVRSELGDEGARTYGAGGTLVVASARTAVDQRNLEAVATAARRLGESVESVDPGEAAAVHPAPAHPLRSAIYLPAESWIDTSRWVGAIESRLLARGVTFVDEVVTRLTAGPSGSSVETRRNRLSAGAVVVAAGAATSRLLDASGYKGLIPDVHGGKGTSLLVSADPDVPLREVVRTPNRAFACGIHLVPRADGIYVGATNRFSTQPGATGTATAGELHLLLHSAIHELDTRLAGRNVLALFHGDRPVAADGRAVVGATDVPNLIAATGTYRNGILLAPLIGEAVVGELLGTAMPDSVPVAWSPRNRQPTRSPESLFEAASEQLVAMLLEPTGDLPYDNRQRLEIVLAAALPGLKDRVVDGTTVEDRLRTVPLVEVVPELLALMARHR